MQRKIYVDLNNYECGCSKYFEALLSLKYRAFQSFSHLWFRGHQQIGQFKPRAMLKTKHL